MILSGPFVHVYSLYAENVMTIYGTTELSRFRTNGDAIWTRVFSHYSYVIALKAIKSIGRGESFQGQCGGQYVIDIMDLLMSRMTISR
jgi:hypothetical protein